MISETLIFPLRIIVPFYDTKIPENELLKNDEDQTIK